jgi:hypothetical protein
MDKENKNINEDVVIEADENLDDSVIAEENAIDTIKKLKEKLKKGCRRKTGIFEFLAKR